MKKYLTVFVILLLISAVLLPSGDALAAERHFHPRISFDTALDNAAGLSSPGKFYLSADVKATADIVISGETSLCLNGHSLDMGSFSILVPDGATFELYDCPESSSGVIKGTDAENAVIEVVGTFNLHSGKLTAIGRSTVFNHGFTSIVGGHIYGSDIMLIKTNGSGLLNISGGVFEAAGSGSALCMVESPEDANAKKRDYNVGVSGGKFSAQSGSEGSLIVNAPKGRFVINTGADIKGFGCPAVCVKSGNFDAYGGAVVSADSESAIVGTGGKVSLYYAYINSEEKYGVDIRDNAELLLSGSLDIVGGLAGVHLAEGRVFSMSDYGFYGDVRISILTDKTPAEGERVAISTKCDPKHYPHFLSANAGCSITYDEAQGIIYTSYDGSIAHSHDSRNYVHALNSSYSDVSKNNYYLESDINAPGFFVGSVVNICLNGHTLNLSNAIKLYPNSTLNIFDCQGTGKIQCGSVCIQDINDGGAKLVVHQGSIVSLGGCAVKLSGTDSIVMKGGEIRADAPGAFAVEVSGSGNSITLDAGSISGSGAAVNVVDYYPTAAELAAGDGSGLIQLSLSGREGSLESENYAMMCSGTKESVIELGASPILNGGIADISLSPARLIRTSEDFAAEEKLRIEIQNGRTAASLGVVADAAHAAMFESLDPVYTFMANENNALELVKSLPISPDAVEINFGEKAVFEIQHGSGSIHWYMRSPDGLITLENATDASLETPAGLSPGEYDVYCLVTDGVEKYASDIAKLTVKKNSIVDISVNTESELLYSGDTQQIFIEDSAKTTDGRNADFTYSLDGHSYSADVPVIGPDSGEYTVYYKVSAEGCDDVYGEFTVSIKEGKYTSVSDENALRAKAIIVSALILVILCIVYLLSKLKAAAKKKK